MMRNEIANVVSILPGTILFPDPSAQQLFKIFRNTNMTKTHSGILTNTNYFGQLQ